MNKGDEETDLHGCLLLHFFWRGDLFLQCLRETKRKTTFLGVEVAGGGGSSLLA